LKESVVTKTLRSLGVAAFATLVAGSLQVSPYAQGTQLPPSAVRPGKGLVPLSNVPSTFSKYSKRVSPQDGFAMQATMLAGAAATAPTPRDADGHPDLSGHWGMAFANPMGQPGLRRIGGFEPDQAAMQRGAQWNKPMYKPELWDKVRSLDFSKADVDPNYGCGKPAGVPRQNVPGQIVQKDGQIWLLNGVDNAMRILPLNGTRDPNDDQYSTFNGMGVARWDGDTLVVESIGFSDETWLGWEGYFHSDQMKVTERFLRQGNILFYNFTVDDPQVLTEPWTSFTYVRTYNGTPARMGEAGTCSERDINLLVDPYLRG